MEAEDNPFQAPQTTNTGAEYHPGEDPRRIGLARQVPIVAVLLIVQGALLSMVGIGFFVWAIYFGGVVVEQMARQQRANPAQQAISPETFGWIVKGWSGAPGAMLLIAGVLAIWGGILNYSYRGRVLGILALVSGMVSLFTCYCLPTSLMLMTYGLVIYLSADAERAFRWREVTQVP